MPKSQKINVHTMYTNDNFSVTAVLNTTNLRPQFKL